MLELKIKIKILFFVSLMISLTQELDINLLNILRDSKCKTKIKTNTTGDGNKVYAGTSLYPMSYKKSNAISTVIAYIVDETRFEEIANANGVNIRTKIAHDLGQFNHEMIVLGVKNCQNDEFHLISAFIFNIIKPRPDQMSLRIMGEQSFDRMYLHDGLPLAQYQENPNICGGSLQEHLITVFPNMAYRSKRLDPSNIKEVRFYEYIGERHPKYPSEARWKIFLENGKYVPAANFNAYRNEYNFVKRHPKENVHLLIVDGKIYNHLTFNNLPWFEEIKKIMNEMSRENEILCIMGCFNFDWSEIHIVTQIILKHSEIGKTARNKDYNVFTIGIGMFDAFFQNTFKHDKRRLSPTLNEKVIDLVKRFNGGTMKEKTIEIFDLNASNVTTMQIYSINGRYIPQEEFKNYCFSKQHPKAKFAFIVMDASEMHNQNVFSVTQVKKYVEMLKQNDIAVFVIKTNNFKLYDLHIIPEWIQSHLKAVHPNRIIVLGGGSFDTTFEFVSPQYDVTYPLLNVASELKEIRKAFVNTADDKGVIVANIYTSNFGSCRFPMHTINGFYDPVVLATNDMFHTEGGIKILFLIMKADNFNQMETALSTVEPTLITDLREKIASHYPTPQWAVYLVGLDNFGEKDFHLFAEFVKIRTNDVRPLREFVYIFGDGIYQAAYEYRDTLPFYTAMNMPLADTFNEFFYSIDIISNMFNEDISLYE